MVLIDTCIIYRWLHNKLDKPELTARLLSEGALVSAVSVWEMAIKASQGKMELLSNDIKGDIVSEGFTLLSITPAHAQAVLPLSKHHKDPFDRLLIAQATCESLTVVTYDKVFSAYLPGAVVL